MTAPGFLPKQCLNHNKIQIFRFL